MTDEKDKGYNWDARDYHDSSSVQTLWGLELMEKLQLSGGEHVLDIGCGDGRLTACLAARVPGGAVVGIDSSREMVAFAKATFSADAFPNISFQVMDAREMTFDGLFDVAFSNATLHWIIGHGPVVKGIAKGLRKGGRVLLQMGGQGNALGIIAAMNAVTGTKEWRSYYSNFTFPYGFYGPDAYRHWLGQAGLRALRVELITRDMVHDDRDGLEAWIRTTWLPYLQRLPDSRKDDFVREVVGSYLELHPGDGHGRTHVNMVRLEVEAVRD